MDRTPWVVIYDVLDRALQHACDDAEDLVYEGEIREALQALEDLAEAAKDRPWRGNGPTPEEAGGESILVRRLDGNLHLFLWERTDNREGYPTGWYGNGCPVEALSSPPTGWRPMPKADGDAFTVKLTPWDPLARFEDFEPFVASEAAVCVLCDLTVGHSHPRKRCLACGAIGLAENMTEERHRCATPAPKP